MGRWAQRRTVGGSSPTSPPTARVQIIEITLDTIIELSVTYNAVVTAADFQLTSFATDVTHQYPINMSNDGPTTLHLEFDSSIASDDFLTFTGTVLNVISPQKVLIE